MAAGLCAAAPARAANPVVVMETSMGTIKIELFAASIPKHEHKVHAGASPGRTECAVTVVLDGARR